MIESIHAGDLIRLPSGNIIVVVAKAGRHEWLCQYTEQARARGEVIFTSAFLRDWGQRA